MGLLSVLNKLILVKFLEQYQKVLNRCQLLLLTCDFCYLLHGLGAQAVNQPGRNEHPPLPQALHPLLTCPQPRESRRVLGEKSGG